MRGCTNSDSAQCRKSEFRLERPCTNSEFLQHQLRVSARTNSYFGSYFPGSTLDRSWQRREELSALQTLQFGAAVPTGHFYLWHEASLSVRSSTVIAPREFVAARRRPAHRRTSW